MSKKVFIFGVLVIALLIASLYRAKYGARDAKAEIEVLDAKIVEMERQRTLLEAELAHMSRREWIEEYARNVLGMGPAAAQQFAKAADLDNLIGPPTVTPEPAETPTREGPG